jgi:hypothetical protein
LILERRSAVGSPPDGAAVAISAQRDGALRPLFTGTLRVVPDGALNCELVLEGACTGIEASTAALRHLLVALKDELAKTCLRHEMGSD